jgi:metal-responsive CopG/Arc/MetJ family transcriptional regulator
MKTAISIPDDIFEAAEREAERLSMSRSELYATAVREFLKARSREDVTRRLNEVYSQESSDVDPVMNAMQFLALKHSPW